MKFTVISDVTNLQLIAKGNGVDLRHYLNRTYADGRRVDWRKLKGRATVEYVNSEIWEVELHWFEARRPHRQLCLAISSIARRNGWPGHL